MMKFNLSLFFLLKLIILLSTVQSFSIKAQENPVFSHLLAQDGLTQDYITALAQDSQGFIWVGTQEGLNRWDGIKVKRFLNIPNQIDTLSNDYVSHILPTQQGQLWIATIDGGINIFDEVNQNFERFIGYEKELTLPKIRIRALHQSKNSNIWLGTESNGIYVIDIKNKSMKHIISNNTTNSLSSNNIRAITSDFQGRIWIATEGGGVNMWDQHSLRFIHYRAGAQSGQSLPSDKALSVTPMTDGTVWVGTYDSGIAVINPSLRKSVHFIHKETDYFSIADNRIRTILQDADGRIWVGTDSGLDLWNSDIRGFNHYRHDDSSRYSLTDNRVTTLLQDKGGVLWVGTFSGLNRWNARLGSIAHIKKNDKKPSSLNSNIITSFADDADGSLWVGTWGGGLNKLNKQDNRIDHFTPSGAAGSLSDNRVMSLLNDSKNRLWVGTLRGGLNLKAPNQDDFSVYRHNDKKTTSISHNAITRIFEDSDNTIWVSTFGGGVNRFDGNGFTQFRYSTTNKDSLGSDRVIGIAESPKGVLWFATDGGGVSYYVKATQQLKRLVSTKSNVTIDDSMSFISLLATSKSLWLGSKDNGLLQVNLNSETFNVDDIKHFSRQNGLPSNVVFGILEDDTGMIWLSSNKGISAISPESGEVKNFGLNHGLQGNEFNSGAYLKAKDGTLYFGGNNGFNHFNPRHLLVSSNQHQPDVVITQFEVFNKTKKLDQPLTELNQISLEYFENFITFEFAGLDYTQPKKNIYQYRMIGLSEQWSEPNSNNRASFTNLSPGNYQFQFKSANNDGLWSEAKTINITLNNPPWLSLPAYAAYFLLIIIIIWQVSLLIKRKTKQLAEQQSNQALRMYLNCLDEASNGVAIIDYLGCYIYQNKSFLALIDQNQLKQAQHNIKQELFIDEVLANKAINEAINCGEWQGEIQNYQGHQAVFIDLGLTRVESSGNEQETIIVVAHEVTNLKQSQDDLLRYRDRLESLVYKRTQELEQEIEKHQKMEDKLTVSLKEKEMLLKEVHHRVKNNMQVISSLLNMQANMVNDTKYSELLNESQNRIRSMALIHESLYQSENFLEIDFNDYIHLLAGTLSRVYTSNTFGIDIQIIADDVYLDIDTAVPCGLIINELVSNAYKHAFNETTDKGKVFIHMYIEDNNYVLKVQDNGVGFPEGVNFKETSSLGMEIVCILIEQIRAKIELFRDNGATFVITFPVKEKEK